MARTSNNIIVLEMPLILILIVSAVLSRIPLSTTLYYIIGILVCYSVSRLLLDYLDLKNNATVTVVLLAFFLMSIIILLNYLASVRLGTITQPFVPGGDAEYYFSSGVLLSESGILATLPYMSGNYAGYPIVLGVLFRIFGPDLMVGMLLNLMISLIAIIMIGRITFLLFHNDRITRNAIILSSISPQILSIGTILLKDAFIVLAFCMVILSMLNIKDSNRPAVNYLMLFGGLLIISFFRVSILFALLLIGIAIYSGREKIARTISVLLLAVIIAFYFYVGQSFLLRQATIEDLGSGFLSNREITEKLKKETTGTSTVKFIIGDYTEKSMIFRLFLIPGPILVQYLTPFDFYNFRKTFDYPWFFIFTNMNIIWIAFTGLLLIFSLFHLKYLKQPLPKRLFYVGLFLYAFIAYGYGGTVPRYIIPFMPMLMPVGGWIYAAIQSDQKIHHRWKVFRFSVYSFGFLMFLLFFLVR